jgi:hypothetical protein
MHNLDGKQLIRFPNLTDTEMNACDETREPKLMGDNRRNPHVLPLIGPNRILEAGRPSLTDVIYSRPHLSKSAPLNAFQINTRIERAVLLQLSSPHCHPMEMAPSGERLMVSHNRLLRHFRRPLAVFVVDRITYLQRSPKSSSGGVTKPIVGNALLLAPDPPQRRHVRL